LVFLFPAIARIVQWITGHDHIENWNYRSVIGKLNYLANNTRPDISMVVHQCACFCSNPNMN
jgi:hypothetical protein